MNSRARVRFVDTFHESVNHYFMLSLTYLAHPNGHLVYSAASYVFVRGNKLPIVLDIEPIVPDNLLSPKEAMLILARRLLTKYKHIPRNSPLEFVVDSAFASFESLSEVEGLGGRVTMYSPIINLTQS